MKQADPVVLPHIHYTDIPHKDIISMPSFLTRRPYKGIVHLEFGSQSLVTRAMMRIQEFYESPCPELRGQFFTRHEAEIRYAERHPKQPDYYTEWNGFNVPGSSVRRWMNIFGDADEREREVLKALRPEILGTGEFYLLATHDEGDLDHELSHAFYHLDPDYRENARCQLDSVRRSMPSLVRLLTKTLYGWGYSEEVMDDELVAYIGTSPAGYLAWRGKIPVTDSIAIEAAGEGIRLQLGLAKKRNEVRP